MEIVGGIEGVGDYFVSSVVDRYRFRERDSVSSSTCRMIVIDRIERQIVPLKETRQET